MPFGIVTGFTEVEHITPHNLKSLNAAVAGSGNYVLKIGKQLQASMQTANKLRILDGYGMMGGAQWGMEPSEYVDLTIDNGTQGMNRVDLVVARYDRTGAKNIESVTLRVIKGTPSSGAPSVPAFVTGDILAGAATAEMPLYKVQLSGLTVAAPVAMFEVLTPSKDAWDSVSKKLWSGSLVGGGSITVPGLAGVKIIGLKFGGSIDTVHSVVLKDGETAFDLVQTDGGAQNWKLVGFYGKITVTGSTVLCGRCGIMVAESSGLGSPFVLTSGDAHSITEVWRIS